MVARRAIIDPDVRVASFRERIEAGELHFFPAPTWGQFSAAGHQKTLERRHGVTASERMLLLKYQSKVPYPSRAIHATFTMAASDSPSPNGAR
jgi:hypothetical protein